MTLLFLVTNTLSALEVTRHRCWTIEIHILLTSLSTHSLTHANSRLMAQDVPTYYWNIFWTLMVCTWSKCNATKLYFIGSDLLLMDGYRNTW